MSAAKKKRLGLVWVEHSSGRQITLRLGALGRVLGEVFEVKGEWFFRAFDGRDSNLSRGERGGFKSQAQAGLANHVRGLVARGVTL